MKDFNEYIADGVVKRQTPDNSRAESLIGESIKSYKILNEFIDKIGITDENANYIIKNAYDIIMEVIRAKMLKKGFNSSGPGAHEAEVAFLKQLGFKESDIRFADKLRYFRNGILYYGKSFDKEYALKVISLLGLIYKTLIET